MSDHLRPDEFVDAIDEALSPERRAHLENCAACRGELGDLLAMQAETRADGVPEPSPLFWDHFSARVSGATSQENIAAPWWHVMVRPLAALALAAASVTMVLVLRPHTPQETPAASPVPVTSTANSALEDDGSWGIVMDLASGIAWDDIHDAVSPAAGAADDAIEELTGEQREALVRLLKQEIGE